MARRKSSSTPPAPTQEPHDNFTPTPFDPNTAIQNPSDFILDPTQLHPLAGLDQNTLDYLQLEDSVLSDLPGAQSALPSRGWSDDLCYGTGISYLSALTVGGAWGLAEGLQKNPASMPPRLRLNGVLNAVTRRGPFLGNSAGVVAMVYNGINSTIGHYRGKHDMTNSVLAGAASGAIFKSTRGVRPMMISSGIVAGVAGTWALFRKVYFERD
ncbi:mitochondrial import inner membrane translocase subunit tim23 [Massarina eburnea CBS 473.64]|uniref:Mitochondrial import inner membrane translocase subunit tim23 n=1 Tax=Massarina eburnea CBS 473.64 TaxID=1395130 RepID=A0A6A6RNL7_9PLEO|nr:mitochondrial import inner membrane translocase subunit tim23 [Massarina eburnea CBS 473.64]